MVLSESKIEVRYAETDQMGVVHHAVYPVWYEVARTDYMKKTGMTYAEMEKMGVMTPVVDLGCHYVGSAYYGETITVRVRILELSAAMMRISAPLSGAVLLSFLMLMRWYMRRRRNGSGCSTI